MTDAPERIWALHNYVSGVENILSGSFILEPSKVVTTTEYIRADLADALAQNVRVKLLEWVETQGGALVSGPYNVVERVDEKGWGASALFISDDREGHEDNFYTTILPHGSKEDCLKACEDADRNIRSALEPADPLDEDDDLTIAYLVGVHDKRAQNPLDHPKVKALVEALQWYADETNWDQTSAANDDPHDGRMRDVWNGDFADGWAIARAALAAMKSP